MEQIDIDILKFQNQYLKEGLDALARELTRSAVSEYNPTHKEMLELGNWAHELIKLLEIEE